MTAPDVHRPRVRIVGDGRAGGSFAAALSGVGWPVEVAPRDSEGSTVADGVDLVLLCVPDPVVAGVAAGIAPSDSAVIAHCAGSLGLDVLAPARRRASVHPLVALPDAGRGAEALRGAWFAVAGEPVARRVVDALGGRAVEVADEHRVSYHAAAVIASNHLVALMGQVERVAAASGVPLDAFLELSRGSLDDVAALGAASALTGPVARGDDATLRRHLAALDPAEREAYRALADAAARLVGRRPPEWDLR